MVFKFLRIFVKKKMTEIDLIQQRNLETFTPFCQVLLNLIEYYPLCRPEPLHYHESFCLVHVVLKSFLDDTKHVKIFHKA